MKTTDEIVQGLREMANPEYTKKMEHFGIVSVDALGIRNSELKPYAKTIGRNQQLAEELWKLNIHEAKLLTVLLSEPAKLDVAVAEQWVSEIYSWDICDGLGMKIFPKTRYGYEKAVEWSNRKPEFEKRAGFATMVGIILDRKVPDDTIASFFSIMEREAWDERNFVKKAVNWALRQAGKRNLYLHEKALTCAEKILDQDTKPARWIARDALRELKSEVILERLEKKHKKRAD